MQLFDAAMLGRLSLPPLLTAQSSRHWSTTSLDVSKSSPKCALKDNLECRARRRFHENLTEKRSHRYDSLGKGEWQLPSTDQTQSAVLVEDEEKTWEECKQLVSSLNFTGEEANVMLGKAFGWVHSPYWGEERKREVPKNEGLNEMLDFLRNLGLSDDDLHKLLKKFPEVLGCSLDNEVKTNISVLEREWGIKGKTLRSLLLRNRRSWATMWIAKATVLLNAHAAGRGSSWLRNHLSSLVLRLRVLELTLGQRTHRLPPTLDLQM